MQIEIKNEHWEQLLRESNDVLSVVPKEYTILCLSSGGKINEKFFMKKIEEMTGAIPKECIWVDICYDQEKIANPLDICLNSFQSAYEYLEISKTKIDLIISFGLQYSAFRDKNSLTNIGNILTDVPWLNFYYKKVDITNYSSSVAKEIQTSLFKGYGLTQLKFTFDDDNAFKNITSFYYEVNC